ncbi:MAG: hypothetical protein GWN86_06850 [Desulfobacterales bacterium]|nr:hypothetical protein [Desulfobacterales bacterium]
MGRRCSICASPHAQKVNRDIVQKRPMAQIAEAYNLSVDSVQRHRNNHLSAMVERGQLLIQKQRGDKDPNYHKLAELANEPVMDLRAQLHHVNVEALNVLKEAKATNNLMVVLRAIDRVHHQMEFQAKLLGRMLEPDQRPVTVNLQQNFKIENAIIDALKPYPEAHSAVIEVLEKAIEGARVPDPHIDGIKEVGGLPVN